MTTKAEREAAEAADSNRTTTLSDEVLATADANITDADRKAEAKRRADWTPPEGHTVSLDPAVVEQGDALVVDESLPADGIVESAAPAEVILSMQYEGGPKVKAGEQDPSAVLEAGAREVPEPEPEPQAAKAVNPRGSKAAEADDDKAGGRHSKSEDKTSK